MLTSEKARHFLRLAVLEDLELIGLEVGDRVPLRVGDERIDLDVVHLDAEGEPEVRVGRRLPAPVPACWAASSGTKSGDEEWQT